MRIRRSASRRPPSVPVGPQEAWWAAPKAPGSPDLLVAFRCGQAPRLSWPCARYSPAHGVNAGRDTSDMASTCKGSMCEGPHVGPHDTRGPQCVARDPYTEAAASGRHIRDFECCAASAPPGVAPLRRACPCAAWGGAQSVVVAPRWALGHRLRRCLRGTRAASALLHCSSVFFVALCGLFFVFWRRVAALPSCPARRGGCVAVCLGGRCVSCLGAAAAAVASLGFVVYFWRRVVALPSCPARRGDCVAGVSLCVSAVDVCRVWGRGRRRWRSLQRRPVKFLRASYRRAP